MEGRHGRALEPPLDRHVGAVQRGLGPVRYGTDHGLDEAHDPTRLVDNASGWTDKGVGDVSDIHIYPGPDMPPLEEKRAAVLGEFGGLGLPLTGHLWQAEGNWGYRNFDDTRVYESRYADLIKNLYPLVDKGLAAAVYTQTSDCEVEVNGLMTYDRAVIKLDPARFSTLNRGFLPPSFVADQTLFVGPSFLVELAVRPGPTIRFTVDGSEPGPEAALYDKPIVITGETTVKARAFWPDGVSSLVESRTFKPAEPFAASAVAPAARGLAYEYFEGRFEKMPDFAAMTASRTGTAAAARRRGRRRQGRIRPAIPRLCPRPEDRGLRFLPQLGRRERTFGRTAGRSSSMTVSTAWPRRRPRSPWRRAGTRSRSTIFRWTGTGAGARLARAGISQRGLPAALGRALLRARTGGPRL